MSKVIATLSHLLVISLLVQVTCAIKPGNLLGYLTGERTLRHGRSDSKPEGFTEDPLWPCKWFCSQNRTSTKSKPYPAFTIKCPKEAINENGTYTPTCRQLCDTYCPSWCTDTKLKCPVEEAPNIFSGKDLVLFIFVISGIPLICVCGCIIYCIYGIMKLARRPQNNFGVPYNGEMPVVQPGPVATMSSQSNKTQPKTDPAYPYLTEY